MAKKAKKVVKKVSRAKKSVGPLFSTGESTSFSRFEWDIIYQALKRQIDHMRERGFYGAGGYPRDIIMRDLEFLERELMPKVRELGTKFDHIKRPDYKADKFY